MHVNDDLGAESLRWLMDSLLRVLAGLGAAEVAARLPWQADGGEHAAAAVPGAFAADDVQALSIAFQLLNHAEENSVAQQRRA